MRSTENDEVGRGLRDRRRGTLGRFSDCIFCICYQCCSEWCQMPARIMAASRLVGWNVALLTEGN
jgi:hypothetical protein